jgi:hypothetical protein
MNHILSFKNFTINERHNQISLDKKSIQDRLVDIGTKEGIKINIIEDSIDISSSKIKIRIDYLDKQSIDKINNLMDHYGWFPTNIKSPGNPRIKYSEGIKNYLNKIDVEIQYEAKIGEEFNISPNKTKAYHVTPDILLDKIKNEGLKPKTESKLSDHPERIYLFLNPDETFNQMVKVLWNSLSEEKRKNIKNYYILEIDLTKIPGNKFYMDSQSSLTYASIFTTQSIPNSAIKVIDKISTHDIKTEYVPSQDEIERDEEERRKREIGWEESKRNKENTDSRYSEITKKINQLSPDELNVSLNDLLGSQK